MDLTFFGFFIFLGCTIVSRILSERAFSSLTPEQKVLLMDAFAGMRAYSMLPLVVILGAMLRE